MDTTATEMTHMAIYATIASRVVYEPGRYHKSGDDYFESWTLEGVKQDLDLIGQIMAELANNEDYPQYYDGVSFGN